MSSSGAPSSLDTPEDAKLSEVQPSSPSMRATPIPENDNGSPPKSLDLDASAAGDQSDTPAGEVSVLEKISNAVDHVMHSGFSKLGAFVAFRPWLVIGLSLLFVIIASLGFSSFETESRAEKLWVPQDAIALEHSAFVSSTFDDGTRIALIQANPSGNVFTPAALQSFVELQDFVESFSVEVTDEEDASFPELFPGKWNLTRLCVQVSGSCFQTSILDAFGNDRDLINNFTDTAEVLAYVNALPGWFTDAGTFIEPSSVIGGLKYDADGLITSGDIAQFTYFLQANEVVVNNQGADPPGEAWETKLNEQLLEKGFFNSGPTNLEVTGYTLTALFTAFSDSINGDLALLGSGYVLIIIYVSIQLGPFHKVHSKVALALAGVLSVGMAIATSYGLASAMGVFFGPVHNVLPFLLLGIGVDDMFIIVNAYHNELAEDYKKKQKRSVVQLVSAALGHAGISITVTSVSDVSAFLIGASTVLPALSSFCIYAALGILFDFIFQITFFTAVLALDAKRANDHRWDCLCCLKVDTPEEAAYVPQTTMTVLGKTFPDGRAFLRTTYANTILNPKVSAFIIVLFAAMTGCGIYFATLLRQEFSFRFFISDDSFLQEYYDVADVYFPSRVRVDIVVQEFDVFEDQLKTQELSDYLFSGDSVFLDQAETASWYNDFYAYAQININATNLDDAGFFVDADTFYNTVNLYLTTQGTRFADNVVWTNSEDPTEGIAAQRFQAVYKDATVADSALQVVAMQDLRSEITAATTLPAFPFARDYIFWEQYAIIEQELVRNILLSLLAIFIVTEILIAHPVTASLVFVGVGMTLVDILGVMYLWGVGIDSVAVVNLVLAIGLSVDYSAHVGHCFMIYRGDNKERVALALGDIGGSVLNGAFSTFLAVIVLAGAGSYIFRVFFKQFFAIVLLGVAHGMIFLPVILNLFGPKFNSTAKVAPLGLAILDRPAKVAAQKMNVIAVQENSRSDNTAPVEAQQVGPLKVIV